MILYDCPKSQLSSKQLNVQRDGRDSLRPEPTIPDDLAVGRDAAQGGGEAPWLKPM
jgi:hypothetical protein